MSTAKRRTAISFRSATIEAELLRRYGNKHQGAKRDLLDYYEWVEATLAFHPQKLVGAKWIYRYWLKEGSSTIGLSVPTKAYNVACARLREAHPRVDPFALTQADYEAAGFRILGR